MQRKYIFLFYLFFLLFIPEILNAQSEIIQNGGFETGNLSPWICYAGVEESPIFIPCDLVTNTESYEGEYSLEIGAGITPLSVKQEFSPPVIAGGALSFWVLIPSNLDPGDCGDFDCALSFSLSVKYSDSKQSYSITSQLTGSGWKKIDIPVSQSDEIIAIVFTAWEINTLYIDEVSLPGTTIDEFPWELFYPAFIKKRNQQEQSNGH